VDTITINLQQIDEGRLLTNFISLTAIEKHARLPPSIDITSVHCTQSGGIWLSPAGVPSSGIDRPALAQFLFTGQRQSFMGTTRSDMMRSTRAEPKTSLVAYVFITVPAKTLRRGGTDRSGGHEREPIMFRSNREVVILRDEFRIIRPPQHGVSSLATI